jgi:hypothetical protein
VRHSMFDLENRQPRIDVLFREAGAQQRIAMMAGIDNISVVQGGEVARHTKIGRVPEHLRPMAVRCHRVAQLGVAGRQKCMMCLVRTADVLAGDQPARPTGPQGREALTTLSASCLS